MSEPCSEGMNEAKEKHGKTKSWRPAGDSDPEICNAAKKHKHSLSESIVDNEEAKESSSTEEGTDNAILVAKHYNSLVNEGLSVRNRSRILYMRNFNNWIKNELLNEYISKIKHKAHGYPINVLDMCCGKGGDLHKWKNMNITHLICADLVEITVQQCQDRYKDISKKTHKGLFTAEFITADCTKVRLREKFKDPSILLNIVSCQFAFHYCFESLPQAECMLKNASECLKPGGYFIGTIPDAYDLVSRWQRCDGNSFGNEIYNIQFWCDKTKPPIFGAKYNFQLEGVVNCPEFLVYLPVFCKLALKFDLELTLFERFDTFFERMKERSPANLQRIQGLETYPPRQEESLAGKADQDYQHAKEYIQNSSNRREIGTLSQPEWEVTSLYAVFAFQKRKTL